MFDVTETQGEVHVERWVGAVSTEEHRIWCFFRTDGYRPHAAPGGLPASAMALRDALVRVTGSRSGVMPTDVPALGRPAGMRCWLDSI